MKRIIKNIVLCNVAIAILLVSSCKDFLTEEPVNSTYSEAFWKSSRDLSSALAGNYALMRNVMNTGNWNPSPSYFMYGDAVAKQYFTIQYTGDGLEGIQNGDYTFQYNVESFADWRRFFKSITMSNIILNRVPKVDDALLDDVANPDKFKNKVMGEAHFLRALAYFMMVRVWGDVPLVTQEYEDPISAEELPRSPKTDVMKQIEADCLKAIEFLDWNYTSQNDAKVTANKGSAQALLAHLYLWRATTTNVTVDQPIMADIDKAEIAINAITANGMYSLTDTANYYNTFVGKSREGIFEIAINDDLREGSNLHIANMFLRTSQIAYYGTNSRCYVNSEYLSNHFYKMGKVWDWYWNSTIGEWEWREGDVRVIDDGDVRYRKNFTDLDTERPTCIKYHNVKYRNAAQKQDAFISNNIIVFRLSDMMLLKAEIALYRGNTRAAIDIINSFRKRNGADPTAMLANTLTNDEVFYEYALERGKEMYLEGHIMFDLIRTRQYKNFVGWLSESRFKQEGFYWPINPALFKNNNKLVQTSYWRGKL